MKHSPRLRRFLPLIALLLAGASASYPQKAGSKLMQPELLKDTAPKEYRVRLDTTRGEMIILVHRDWAPLAADRFYNLVKNGFYDGSPFHRVLPGFVAQFGINPNPAIQAKWRKQTLKDEPVKGHNGLGIVSFAASGANSRTTQVFVNLKDSKSLDIQGFTPFGDMIKGIGVAALLYGGYRDKPDPERIMKQGASYLKSNYPKLDYIKTATIQ